MNTIEVKNLSKKFRMIHGKEDTLKGRVMSMFRKHRPITEEFWALKDVTFKVKKGETIGIIGSNGSGKTTLLRVLAGILYPDQGEMKLKGKISTLFELGTGFHPELTGRENIYLNGAILGLGRKEVGKKFNTIVAFSELGDFIDTPLKFYSTGMHVRLAFAIAISVEPEVLIVDEVLAVGDASFQEKSFSAMEEFKRNGVTVVIVSHDLNTVEGFCDKVILLDKGNMVSIGKPKKVINDYFDIVEKKELENFTRKQTSVKETRWGDRRVEIIDAWISEKDERSSIIKSTTFRLHVKHKFNKTVKAPIFGISIRDLEGKDIYVTNTAWKNIDTRTFLKGEQMTTTYEISNVFGNGEYTISPAVASGSRQYYYDWRENFVRFKVKKELTSGGVIEVPVRIKIYKDSYGIHS